ncbi:MAG: diguanylate cyclase [Magnetococcales bacterium]|nr:diguanylate cyclase [Magnetococcales bacterium]
MEFADMLGGLVDSPLVALALKGSGGEYFYVNPTLCRLLGKSEGELIGRSNQHIFPQAVSEALNQGDDQVLRNKVHRVIGMQLPASEGMRYCLAIKFPILDGLGEVFSVGILAVEQVGHFCMEEEEEGSGELKPVFLCEAKRALLEAEKRAVTDRLTGLGNRRAFEQAASVEMQRLQRFGHPVSLLILDVDHFKRVNDRFGHLAGDQILVGLINITKELLRGTDILCRWGGEEFVVLAANTSLSSARVLADRIRSQVAASPMEPVGAITVSLGVAECKRDESLERWFERADRALYRAKQEGRNRVVCDQTVDSRGSEQEEGGFLQFIWKDIYCCGHPVIDQQHESLFQHANGVVRAILSQQSKEDILSTLDGLITEVRCHFRDEEEILQQVGFVSRVEHQQEHQNLLVQAVQMVNCFRKEQVNLGQVVQYLTYDLILGHMMKTDRGFFPWLRKREVAAS